MFLLFGLMLDVMKSMLGWSRVIVVVLCLVGDGLMLCSVINWFKWVFMWLVDRFFFCISDGLCIIFECE